MRYEYREEVVRPNSTLGFSDGDLALMEARLNKLGAEGWECFEMQSVSVGWLFVYKRPKK